MLITAIVLGWYLLGVLGLLWGMAIARLEITWKDALWTMLYALLGPLGCGAGIYAGIMTYRKELSHNGDA